jgi:two-component system response regulator (stage 0 sporulation protein F)
MTRTAGRVLVVDDDPGIRTMLELALGQEGYEVTTTDGRAGLDASAVDVVLLDVRLGNRSALEPGLRRLLDGGPPVVVMTAGSDAAGVARAIGAADSITKPFDLDLLFATIERCRDAAGRLAGP